MAEDRKSDRIVGAEANGRRAPILPVVSVLISILALTVSVTTAYFSIVYEKDDLRVSIARFPLFFEDDGALWSSGAQSLTLLNLGNRGVVLSEVILSIGKVATTDPECAISDD